MTIAIETLGQPKLIRAFLTTICLPIAALTGAGFIVGGSTSSEIGANVAAVLVVAMVWYVAGRVLIVPYLGRRLYRVLTILALVRIAANLLHFYEVWAPISGIDSSASVLYTDITDQGVIQVSAGVFGETLRADGVAYAVFGDYYRAINNPGVGVVFGALLSVFGPYATVAIPWVILLSLFGAVFAALLGRWAGLPERLSRLVAILVFLMPGFFIFPPLYRDNIMVFLLLFAAWTAVLGNRGPSVATAGVIVAEALMLWSLREVYVVLPFVFSGMAYFARNHANRDKMLLIAVGSSVGLLVGLKYISSLLTDFVARASGSFTSTLSDFSILLPFKSFGAVLFYPAAAVFALLAPMPWWQQGSGSVLAYQVFAYAQAWYGLAVAVAFGSAVFTSGLRRSERLFGVFAGTIFLLTLMGSANFASLYVQVAYPFALIASVRYLAVSWRACVALSGGIIIAAHSILLVA